MCLLPACHFLHGSACCWLVIGNCCNNVGASNHTKQQNKSDSLEFRKEVPFFWYKTIRQNKSDSLEFRKSNLIHLLLVPFCWYKTLFSALWTFPIPPPPPRPSWLMVPPVLLLDVQNLAPANAVLAKSLFTAVSYVKQTTGPVIKTSAKNIYARWAWLSLKKLTNSRKTATGCKPFDALIWRW